MVCLVVTMINRRLAAPFEVSRSVIFDRDSSQDNFCGKTIIDSIKRAWNSMRADAAFADATEHLDHQAPKLPPIHNVPLPAFLTPKNVTLLYADEVHAAITEPDDREKVDKQKFKALYNAIGRATKEFCTSFSLMPSTAVVRVPNLRGEIDLLIPVHKDESGEEEAQRLSTERLTYLEILNEVSPGSVPLNTLQRGVGMHLVTLPSDFDLLTSARLADDLLKRADEDFHKMLNGSDTPIKTDPMQLAPFELLTPELTR